LKADVYCSAQLSPPSPNLSQGKAKGVAQRVCPPEQLGDRKSFVPKMRPITLDTNLVRMICIWTNTARGQNLVSRLLPVKLPVTLKTITGADLSRLPPAQPVTLR
jgi:hypothetical protein